MLKCFRELEIQHTYMCVCTCMCRKIRLKSVLISINKLQNAQDGEKKKKKKREKLRVIFLRNRFIEILCRNPWIYFIFIQNPVNHILRIRNLMYIKVYVTYQLCNTNFRYLNNSSSCKEKINEVLRSQNQNAPKK